MVGVDYTLCEFMIIVKNKSKSVDRKREEDCCVVCVGFSSESDLNSSVSSIWCAFVSESQKVALLLPSVHTTRNTNTLRCGGKVSIEVRYENRHLRLPLPPPRTSHASITCLDVRSFVLSSGSEEHRTINISRC
jgi:hypothetical protein